MCVNSAKEYAERIKEAMRSFPEALPEQAYCDVLKTYNIMKEKFIKFYTDLAQDQGKNVLFINR